MKKCSFIRIWAALLAGAACFIAQQPAWAGSCCGGGGGTTLLLPKYYQGMIDVSLDLEKYDGMWDLNGKIKPDPPGSDLRQYRLNLGYARRFAQRWQASILVPYVWNENTYSSKTTRSEGLGDTTLSLWYEAIDDNSAWKIREFKDLTPSVTIGPSLLIPTGVSPYDDGVKSSFDVTGRGFYRLDGNVIISKTLHPWSATLALSYGTYHRRAVDQEYSRYVEPYWKKLGDRTSSSLSVSYIYYLGSGGDTLTGTASFSRVHEAEESNNDDRNLFSGFKKDALGGTIAYSSTDHDWSVRGSWVHAIQQDGWGYNFPCTDIYTVGVSYGFR